MSFRSFEGQLDLPAYIIPKKKQYRHDINKETKPGMLKLNTAFFKLFGGTLMFGNKVFLYETINDIHGYIILFHYHFSTPY